MVPNQGLYMINQYSVKFRLTVSSAIQIFNWFDLRTKNKDEMNEAPEAQKIFYSFWGRWMKQANYFLKEEAKILEGKISVKKAQTCCRRHHFIIIYSFKT